MTSVTKRQWSISQTATHLHIEIYEKGLKKDEVQFETDEPATALRSGAATALRSGQRSGQRQIKLQVREQSLTIPLPCGADTSSLEWSLTAYKIEVKVPKALHDEDNADDAATDSGPEKKSTKPTYPTSKQGHTTDWDTLFHESLKEEEEEEKNNGINGLFQHLYAGADDDARRAMAKSYSMSGGTTLSMNWKEVATADYKGGTA